MTLTLPKPSEQRLARSPLELVVCQLRHEPLDAANLKIRARNIRRLLGDAYTTMVPGGPVQLRVAASPAGVDVEEQRGWQLSSGDGGWTAVIANESFALETTRYLDWDDFKGRFTDLTNAVAESSDIVAELRLGLRYIDRLTEPDAESPHYWTQWLKPAFAGPLAAPELAPAVLALQAITQFDGGDGFRVNLRFGCVESEATGRWDYLLDHDCYRESHLEFSVESFLAAMERLHTLALQTFQAAITPEYFELLSGAA